MTKEKCKFNHNLIVMNEIERDKVELRSNKIRLSEIE